MRIPAHVGPGSVDPESVDLDAVDLTDPRLYGRGDPHAVWHALRLREPVRRCRNGRGQEFWSVAAYADVEEVLRDHGTYTTERGVLLDQLGTDDPAGGRQLAVTDPPRHTRLRSPLQHALAIRPVEAQAEAIRALVRKVMAPWASGEPFDFAADMARFPMAVMGALMDVPERDWPTLARLTAVSAAADDPEYRAPGGPQATVRAAHRELFSYFQGVVQRRRRSLGDDLISLLLTMEVEGERLQPGDVVSNCFNLLLGANVTTPHVPSAAILHLLEHGGYDQWRAHPELVVPLVEEALRWASPTNHFVRHATRDTVLRGVPIRAGDAVVVWFGSANRDEEVFPDPYRFDIRRRPNKHIAFGIGPHYCVGHTVVRVGLRVLFEELIENVESFHLAGEPQHLHSNLVAGIKHLPLTVRMRTSSA